MSKDTLQLPKTAFSMKASLPAKEPKILFFYHFFKISGSLLGRLAFIEKAVLGNCKVSLDIII